ncbi:MAG: hypothetical protein R3B96_03470 [Pirellulaceae bacterium]
MLIQRRAAQTGYEPPSSQVLSLYPTLATGGAAGRNDSLACFGLESRRGSDRINRRQR